MTKHYIFQAVNSDGQSVFIDDVPNGKKCGCFCKECKGALIAKQGNIKAHHFAHANGNDSIKCSQTALHLLAKEIIAEEKRIPAFVDGGIKFVEADFVEQEKNLGDIIPDLYAEHNGKPVVVEIFVSHAVDDEKLAKIQNHRLTTFEINLSELVFETKEDVRKAIYDFKNIRLIYDERLTEIFIEYVNQKRKIIMKQGKYKPILNGTVRQCPMCLIRINYGVARPRDVRASFCQDCFFGFISDDKKSVCCIGHLDGTLPAWFLQANVHENRFMSVQETQEKLNEFLRRSRKL